MAVLFYFILFFIQVYLIVANEVVRSNQVLYMKIKDKILSIIKRRLKLS